MDNRSIASRCKELLQFLSSTKGDLANVTGPPALLAPSSVVEVGHCWAQRPAVFAAPAFEPSAERRCLLVLRMMLIALRSQVYVGGSPKTSIRKPLNAFLGELFLAEWTDEREHGGGGGGGDAGNDNISRQDSDGHKEDASIDKDATSHSRNASTDTNASAASGTPSMASLLSCSKVPSSLSSSSSSSSSSCNCGSHSLTTRLVAEQVSHHPPITAMHLADDAHGVRADGYARVEMTFAGSVQVRQVGHAIVRVDRYDEDYLVPLPDVRVRGFLAGRLYPEIIGTYHIVASSGYAVELVFSGQNFAWGGKKNAFVARLLGTDRETLYVVEGVWSEGWTTTDARTGQVLERYVVDAAHNAPAAIRLPPPDAQDPWESRRAWGPVIDGITRGDLAQTVAEKSHIEQAQRRMRAREAASGEVWQPLLFRSSNSSSSSSGSGPESCPRAKAAHDTFLRLAAGLDWPLHDDRTKGVWRVDESKIRNLQRPFRGELTPLG